MDCLRSGLEGPDAGASPLGMLAGLVAPPLGWLGPKKSNPSKESAGLLGF